MSKKQMVQETIFNSGAYEGDGWPPGDLAGFIAWFEERIERIPAEYRATANIEIQSQSGYYGDSSPALEITYTRPETDEQYASRLQREKAAHEAQQAKERAMLAALLKKHGSP